MRLPPLFPGAVLVCAFSLGAGCLGEAPRDNPVDPGSDRFVDEGQLVGRVTDRAGEPLADAEVRLIPGPAHPEPTMLARTDDAGRFLFDGAPTGTDYRVVARKDGYAEGSREPVVVQVGPPVEVPGLALNALPAFTSIRSRSLHVGRWWPESDQYFLEIEAEVRDGDGLFDIDGVWLDIPELGYTMPLEALTDGRYEKVLRADSLPTNGLQQLLGQALRLRVQDREGEVTHSDPRQLARIIETVPVAAAPRDDVVLATDRPALQWDPFPPAFAFSYRIDVFRDEVNRDLLAVRSDGIPPDAVSLRLETPLPSGAYFWIVAVVDAYGNESRSKEAAFRIP